MQENKENTAFYENESEETLNMKAELEKYLFHWKWFFVGVIVALIFAFFFLRYSTPQYSASATIMIKDDESSGISKELAAFEDLGILGGSSNTTENEIAILKSRKIIGAALDSLDLTLFYFKEGRVSRREIFGNNPIKVVFQDTYETVKKHRKDTSFVVHIRSASEFELKDIEDNFISVHNFDDRIPSDFGAFKVQKTLNFDFKEDTEIHISLLNKNKVIDFYKKTLTVIAIDDKSSVLNLSFTYPIKEKAENFLNELVQQYNLDAIQDKNEVSQKTKIFIDERLYAIGIDLNAIQDSVKKFKTDNEITGLSSEGELALETASVNNEKLIQIQIQLKIAKGVLKNIKDQSENNETLPQNLGFSEATISTSIQKYNELVLYKNRLSVSAGGKNPQILQYEKEIIALKYNVKKSISNLIKSLQTQYNEINEEAIKVNARISVIPYLERGFIDIARQQEIISGLYSYLLKKKEETAISLAVTVPNAKIIDVAYGSNIPISPNRKIIYLGALLLGLLIPFIIIYLKNLLDTKVHTRKDIEDATSIPFLGDIPHSETEEKVVINSDIRTSTAEALRVIRTNLDFMLPTIGDNSLGKTVFVSSTIVGEGKSFVAINLATALSLSGKKVLLIGMDLRAHKLTEYLEVSDKKGVVNYIIDSSLTLNELKFSTPKIKALDVIAAGAHPPNPAELLLTERVRTLFTEVKKDYDYIIVDTAPVSLVTDTLLIAKYADMFVYVARANYLDKRMLNVAQTLYNERKLPNMAMLLNDTDMSRGYGYGYSYGYGYGNDHIEEFKNPWYKRML